MSYTIVIKNIHNGSIEVDNEIHHAVRIFQDGSESCVIVDNKNIPALITALQKIQEETK